MFWLVTRFERNNSLILIFWVFNYFIGIITITIGRHFTQLSYVIISKRPYAMDFYEEIYGKITATNDENYVIYLLIHWLVLESGLGLGSQE